MKILLNQTSELNAGATAAMPMAPKNAQEAFQMMCAARKNVMPLLTNEQAAAAAALAYIQSEKNPWVRGSYRPAGF